MRLAPAMWQQQPVMLEENSLVEVIQPVSEWVMRWARAMWQPPAVLQEKSLAVAILLVAANWRSPLLALQANSRETAKPHLLQDLGLPRAAGRLTRARLRGLPLPPVVDSPVPSARARRHSPGPDPCASSLKILVVRKCNLAARCGGRPIFARYRPPSNRRALAGCDNKRSRSQRKHARRARPFPIAALDRYRCLPRQIAD
jgi:hypothetical protein